MGEKYGPFVRLWGILPSQIPAHGASAEDLAQFVGSILGEAVPFVGSLPVSSAPKNGDGLWKPKGCKAFAHSAAPVHLYERVVPTEDLALVAKEHELPQTKNAKLRAETWTLRRSVHEDAAKPGTATWEEWTRSFKDEHAEAENEFTPAVLSTKLKAKWDCNGIEVTLGDVTWENFTLKLEESVHKLPSPLNNRVFPVLQVTASTRGRREFIVVQIAAVPDPSTGEETRPDGALRGAYTSVERFREEGGEQKGVEWVMGTVSDARGMLPVWVQKMAVPGQIAKDVDMYLEWIAEERKKADTSLWSRVCG